MQNLSLKKFTPGDYWESCTLKIECSYCKKILFEINSFDDLRGKKRCVQCKEYHCEDCCKFHLFQRYLCKCEQKPSITRCGFCYKTLCENCTRHCENCERTVCEKCTCQCAHKNCSFTHLCEGCSFSCYDCDQSVCFKNRICEKCDEDVIDCLTICDTCGARICHECIIHETWQCEDCSEYGDIEGSQDFHIWCSYNSCYLEIVALF